MQKENPSRDDLMRLLEQQQQERVAKDIIEMHIKILSASYDKAVTYTNVIIIGGYASFFGLWSLSKPYLSAVQARWAALIMLLSVSTFVFFEVYKMMVTTREQHNYAQILKNPEARTNPNVWLARLQEYEQNCKRQNITFIRIWGINVIVAVVTAAVAVGILGFGLVCGLFAEP
jgi:hypothetical protein